MSRIRAKAEKQALILFSLEWNSQEETGILLGCSANMGFFQKKPPG